MNYVQIVQSCDVMLYELRLCCVSRARFCQAARMETTPVYDSLTETTSDDFIYEYSVNSFVLFENEQCNAVRLSLNPALFE
jgi:hypothetical protein